MSILTPPANTHESDDNRIEVIEVPSSGWRLRDRSKKESDSRGLLGFVEADDTGYDTVWLTPCVAHEHFDTLDAALRAAQVHCGKGRS